MAKDKKSVLVYVDWIHVFESLEDEEAGKLIKHFFRYVNDQNPEPPDKLIKIVFEPIKQTLKRDLSKWEKTVVKLSDAGKKSAENRTETKKNSTSVNQPQPPSTTSTDSVSVSDTVNVKVIDTVKVSEEGMTPAKAAPPEYKSSIPSAKEFFRIEILRKEFLADQIWIEGMCMKFSLSPEKIFLRLDEFETHLRDTKELFKTRKDYAKHFINWQSYKSNGSNPHKSSGRSNKTASSAVITEGRTFGKL